MKKFVSKIKFLSILTFSALFIFTSCEDLAMPSKVEIIASPSYTVPAGTIDSVTDRLDELMSGDALTNLLGDNISIYKYMNSSTDDVMRYLMKFGMSIPLSSATGNEEMSFDDLLNFEIPSIGYEDDGTTLTTLFEIPTISPTMSIDAISLDWSDIGSAALQPTLDFPSVTIGGVAINQTLTVDVDLCSDSNAGSFTSIVFDSTEDSIVTVTFGQFDSGTRAKVTNFCFKNSSTNAEIGTVTDREANLLSSTESERQCTVNLKGCTLPVSFKISMTLDISADASGSLSATQDFSSIHVAKVVGFTKSGLSIDFPAMDPISLGDSLPFKQATFDGSAGGTTGGKLDVALTGLPTGVTLDTFKFNMTQTADGTYEGLAINDTNDNNNLTDSDSDGTYTLPLDAQNLNTGSITCSGELTINASNATISFPLEITPTPTMTISKFSTVKILESTVTSSMPEGGLTQSVEQELAGIQDTVKAMYFDTSSTNKGFGIKVIMENELPMDVGIEVDSTILGLTDSDYNFPTGETTTKYIRTQSYNSQTNCLDLTSTNTSIYGDPDGDGTQNPVFDVDMTIDLGATDGVITLSNIVPGSSYGMGIKIEPVLDIKEVKVDLSSIAEDGSLSYSGTFPEAGEDDSEAEPIDLSMIGSILGDNLQLTGAKVYAYINDNGLLGDNTITAKFDASYTTTDSEGVESTTTVALIDGADESTRVKTIYFKEVPSVTQNSDGYVVATFDEDETSFVSSSFPTVLNAGPEDMMISYEVGLGEGDEEMWLDVSELINSDDDDSDEETEIAVEFGIFIALPVQLTVKQNSNGYAGLDIMGIINSFGSSEEEDSEEEEAETDLLGRTSADDGGLLNTVLDYIEKVALKVDYTNGSGMALSVNISDTNSSGATFSKVISIATGTGTQEISIDSTDAEYMMNTYPFYPDNFEIRIPGSTTQDMVYNIKREMDFEVSLTASVDANIDYTISLSGN